MVANLLLVFINQTFVFIYLFAFQGHQDEVFVLEAHPTDPHILLSAGEVELFTVYLVFCYFTSVSQWNSIVL